MSKKRAKSSKKTPEIVNQTPAPLIVRGSELWNDLTGALAGGLPVPTERTALQISAVYACTALISGAISAMPVHIYKQAATGERDRLPNDDLWWVLNEQWVPRWSAALAWEYVVASYLLHGDGFAKIIRNRYADIVGLLPIHPNRVTVGVTPDAMRLVYAVEADPTVLGFKAEREILDQDDMLHVAGFGFDGVRGLSMLRNGLRMAGSVALATQDYAARFFANSARPDFMLTADGNVSPEGVDSLRKQLDERFTGSQNAHRPMILTNGLKPTVISLPLDDLQLLQLRQFQIEDIARIFGVPPFMIGHTEKTTSWGSGVESMGAGFVKFTLRAHLNKFENEINRKFFRTASRVAAFDTTELERADTKSLFEAFRIALGRAGEPGFMTTEEVRERLNLKRKPDGTLNAGTTNEPVAQPAAQ
ncbi:phage portal protein [Bosea eneae]|uniref:Phage portal protein n=1 Tax=Bosea eneae TaxID=151454 RepID=A0ABW0J0B7_9HYPH